MCQMFSLNNSKMQKPVLLHKSELLSNAWTSREHSELIESIAGSSQHDITYSTYFIVFIGLLLFLYWFKNTSIHLLSTLGFYWSSF